MLKQIKWAEAAECLPIDDIKPNPKNPKKHTKSQIAHIRESILTFGFLDPIGVWGSGHMIVEGHGRLEALKQLVDEGAIEVPEKGIPVIRLDHLSRRDRDAYMLEHNQATMETGWDDDLLDELLGGIKDEGLDMSVFGFDLGGEEDGDEPYSGKVDIPQYQIQGEMPLLSDCLNTGKTHQLIDEIRMSSVTDEEKEFLIAAAQRHSVFNYRKIAEYYAQATPDMQRLMERSALVIIDLDNAIANGYVRLSSDIAAMVEDDATDA